MSEIDNRIKEVEKEIKRLNELNKQVDIHSTDSLEIELDALNFAKSEMEKEIKERVEFIESEARSSQRTRDFSDAYKLMEKREQEIKDKIEDDLKQKISKDPWGYNIVILDYDGFIKFIEQIFNTQETKQ